MTAAALAPLAAGDAATYAMMAAFAALLVGGCACWAGSCALGIVASLLSKPVLIGYLAGVAVIMIAGQLGKLFEVTVSGDRADRADRSARSQLGGAERRDLAVIGPQRDRHAVRRVQPVAAHVPGR